MGVFALRRVEDFKGHPEMLAAKWPRLLRGYEGPSYNSAAAILATLNVKASCSYINNNEDPITYHPSIVSGEWI